MASLLELAAALRRRSTRAERWGVLLGMAALLLPIVAIGRDGVATLPYARATGGRFNEKGLYIDSDGAKTAVLRALASELPAAAVVGLHDSMKATWAQVWALGGRVVQPAAALPRGRSGPSVYLADSHFLSDAQQRELAEAHHVQAVGPFWIVRPGRPAAPIDGYAIREREPSIGQWYWIAGTEPVRTIEPDPFATWELRVHFDQPVEPPTADPQGLEEQRIAHNVALATGDEARATELRHAIESVLTGPETLLGDGTTLVGRRFDDGVQPVLTLVFRACGPAQGEVEIHVRSTVLSPAALSSTMADPTVREVAPPLALSPRRWRAGWLYSHRVVIRKRPGVERFDLTMDSRPPALACLPDAVPSRRRPVELLRLE